MNKKAKILSLCLAAVLLCACVVGFMMVGANAANEGYTHTWTVDGTGGTGTDSTLETTKTFATLQEALTEAKACEGQWKTDDTLQILIATNDGQLPTRTADGILFVETIWRGDRVTEGTFGNKLPITIEGADGYTAMIGPGSSSYAAGYFQKKEGDGTYAKSTACIFTNDYTFKNLKIAMKESANYFSFFYAGSGNVTLDNVDASTLPRANFFGDNRTQAAYIGWTKADVEAIMNDNGGLIPSSFTFKNGTVIYATGSSESASSLKKIAGALYHGVGAEATAFAASTTGEVPADVANLAKPANCSVGIIIPSNVTINYPDYYVHYCPDDVAAVADDETTTDVDETVAAVNYYPASYGNIRVDVRNSSKFYLFRTRPASRAWTTKRDINSNTTIHLYQDLSTLQHGGEDYKLAVLLNCAIPEGKTFDLHLHNGVKYVHNPETEVGIDFASFYGFCTSETSTLNITVHPFEDSTNTAAEYPDGLDLIEYGAKASYANGKINVTIKDGVTINGSLKLYSKTGMRYFDDDDVHTNPVQATHTTTIEEGATVETFMGPRGRVIVNNIQGTVTNFFANTPTTKSSTTAILDMSEADSVTNNIAATAEIENFCGTGYFTRVSHRTDTVVTPAEGEATTTTGKATYSFYYFGEEIPEAGTNTTISSSTDDAGTTTEKIRYYTAHRLYNCEAETVVNNIAAGASVGTFKATSSTDKAQAVTNNIADAQTFASIDATVPGTFVLGENASITIAAIEGKINLSANAWAKDHTYLTYTGTDLLDHLGTTADKTGRVLAVNGEVGETQTLKLAQITPYVNLVLTDRIAVRVYFNMEEVAKVGGVKNLTFDATATGLDSIYVEEVQNDGTDYYFDVYGITASNLNDAVKYTGSVNGTVEKTLNDILKDTMPTEPKTEKENALVNLCKSIQQLGGADVDVPVDEKVSLDGAGVNFYNDTEGKAFTASSYGVVMNDAIGFAIYGTKSESGTITVKLNGGEVVPQGEENRLDVFVKVSKARNLMLVEILDGEGDANFKMKASIEQLAYLAHMNGNETGTYILAYVQAALDYKEACAEAA